MARLEASGAETTTLRDELTRARSALAAAEEIRDVGDMPASRARAKVAELEEMLATRDGAGATRARAAKRTAEAAEKEAERLRAELGERDAEHARMISSLRSTIRGMRDSTPADRVMYLEALRLHAEAAERRNATARNAPVARAATPPPRPSFPPTDFPRIGFATRRRVASPSNAPPPPVERVTTAESPPKPRRRRPAAAPRPPTRRRARGAAARRRRGARHREKTRRDGRRTVERAARRADALRDGLGRARRDAKAAGVLDLHVPSGQRSREHPLNELIRAPLWTNTSQMVYAPAEAVAEAERRADAAEEEGEARRPRAAREQRRRRRTASSAAAAEVGGGRRAG